MGITINNYLSYIDVQRGNDRAVCTGTLRLLSYFEWKKKKTLLTYKPFVRKINCAVTLSQKRENIVIYAKALIFFCELA